MQNVQAGRQLAASLPVLCRGGTQTEEHEKIMVPAWTSGEPYLCGQIVARYFPALGGPGVVQHSAHNKSTEGDVVRPCTLVKQITGTVSCPTTASVVFLICPHPSRYRGGEVITLYRVERRGVPGTIRPPRVRFGYPLPGYQCRSGAVPGVVLVAGPWC